MPTDKVGMANAIKGNGLQFYPVYWTHHDCWQWYWGDYRENGKYHAHYGHTHLFMLGFPWQEKSNDAFSGEQTFDFNIQDLWGPRSSDPNQMTPYKVIGTPKWYWHVQELWRRIYIQRWDERLPITPATTVAGRRGIRWDASPGLNPDFDAWGVPQNLREYNGSLINGIYREGQHFSPMYLPQGGRTLPIEYHLDDTRRVSKRQNYVRDRAKSMIEDWNTSGPRWPMNHPNPALRGQIRWPKVYEEERFALTNPPFVDARYSKAATPTFPDALYIHPIIEYAKVTHLDWERMPGWAAKHDHNADDFGDGWSNSLSLPFKHPGTGKYISPFGPEPGVVRPPGEYFGVYSGADISKQGPLVPLNKRPKYRKREANPPRATATGINGPGYDFENEPFGLPKFQPNDPAFQPDEYNPDLMPVNDDNRADMSEKPVTFFDPYNVGDGRWVQQCLGGLVQVKAEVTLEHKLGGRTTAWVTAAQLIPSEEFAGTDQLRPVNP